MQLFAKFKKSLRRGFRATWNFQKVKVALNPLLRIFFKLCKRLHLFMLIRAQHCNWYGCIYDLGCPFFWKFGNSRNFLFHLAFLPGLNRPQFLKSWKATRWWRAFWVDTTLDAKWSALVRACSWLKMKTLGSDFLENCGVVVPNFLWVSSPGLHTLPREKFVSFSHKYRGRVEFWMRVNLLHTKQFNTAFETATFIMVLQHFLK